MALNKFMHPRNPFYEKTPDFEHLSKLYPEFSKYCIKKSNKQTLDYKDPNALKALYSVLMKEYFGLFEFYFKNYLKKKE